MSVTEEKMKVTVVTGAEFKKMLLNASQNLQANYEYVDSLNVFPVPDGDTGTNMSMTISSGEKEILSFETNHVGEISKKFSRGLLLGARGNSGVILSQIFRGLSNELEPYETITTQVFGEALVKSSEIAYNSVIKPVEGTILTVIRETSEEARVLASQYDDFTAYFEALLVVAQRSLESTPEYLPVLKEVGVVDSGGQGLVYVLEGMYKHLIGETILVSTHTVTSSMNAQQIMDINPEDITFGYCTEFLVKLKNPDKPNMDEYISHLERLGDSIVALKDEDILKTHIHTEDPIRAFELGGRYGDYISMKVENMRMQAGAAKENSSVALEAQGDTKTPVKDESNVHHAFAVITVASGEGIGELFKEYGATHVLDGGQTSNPSTEDFVQLMNKISADNIIILPNNSNIIMAAKQAASLIDDKKVAVVESKTFPQGLASLIGFDPDTHLEANLESMTLKMEDVLSGEVTYAIRDTEIDGVKIHNGEFLSIYERKIISSVPTQIEAVIIIVEEMLKTNEELEILTLITGEGSSDEEVEEIKTRITAMNDELDLEVVEGNQMVYSYIISGE